MKIEGIRKTKNFILDNLIDNSKSIDSLKKKLSSLNIFSSVEASKNKIKVVEDRNRINVSSNGTKNSLNIFLPNILGRAINSKISLSTFSDYNISLSFPVFTKKILFLNFFNTNSLLNLPCGSYPLNKSEIELDIKKLKIGVGVDKIQDDLIKYVRMNLESPIMAISIKQGSTSFTKVELDKKINLNILSWLKYSMRLGVGAIYGKPPKYERFFLGKNVKGYKDNTISPTDFNLKNGGLSYLEVTNKLLLNISKVDLYLFNSFGYNSRQKSLVNTSKEAYKELRNMNNPAYGLSVGIGACMPLSDGSGTLIDASLSFPLTNNKNIEKYQFDLNFDF